MSHDRRLYEQIVERTGLASFIGPGTVLRSLISVGVASAEEATAVDYLRALPHLRGRMSVYLKPEELEQRMAEIERLLRHAV